VDCQEGFSKAQGEELEGGRIYGKMSRRKKTIRRGSLSPDEYVVREEAILNSLRDQKQNL